MKTSQLARFAASLLVLTLLSSCNSAFRRAWSADICPAPPPANGVAGKWEGTWLSAANGHHGELRCVVSGPLEVGKLYEKGDHQFFYHATWKKILSGSYKAIHNVKKQKDGSYIFKGEHQMPNWAGGKYHYQGTIKGDSFSACYECAMDRGTYTMKRVR